LIRLGSGGFPASFVDSVLALLSVELLSSPTVTSCDNDSSTSYIIKINFRHSWVYLGMGRAGVFILSSLKCFDVIIR
jgi:hypothetical protein